MSVNTRWELPARIIELSEANNWKDSVREWYLSDIEVLDPGEHSQCLCGHRPIKELCHIANVRNGNQATVGNHCIEKFDKDDPGHEVFGRVPLIIQAALRILKDSSSSANEALIQFAEKKGIFTKSNAEFYCDIWRKRNLSEGQKRYKMGLNQKLLYELILSVRGAYQRLREAPKEGTAGPKLIQYAFSQGAFKEGDRDFYVKVWDREHKNLTENQRSYKEGLNKKIIQNLANTLDN